MWFKLGKDKIEDVVWRRYEIMTSKLRERRKWSIGWSNGVILIQQMSLHQPCQVLELVCSRVKRGKQFRCPMFDPANFLLKYLFPDSCCSLLILDKEGSKSKGWKGGTVLLLLLMMALLLRVTGYDFKGGKSGRTPGWKSIKARCRKPG